MAARVGVLRFVTRFGRPAALATLATLALMATAIGIVPAPAASAQETFSASVAVEGPTTLRVTWEGAPAGASAIWVSVIAVPSDAARSDVLLAAPGTGGVTWDEAVPGTSFEVVVTAQMQEGPPVEAVVDGGDVTMPVGSGEPPGPPVSAQVDRIQEGYTSVWAEPNPLGAPTERFLIRLDTVPADPAASVDRWISANSAARIGGLRPDTTYDVLVWAVAADGTFSDPVVPGGSPAISAPVGGFDLEPRDVVAIAPDPTTVRVTWSPPPADPRLTLVRYLISIIPESGWDGLNYTIEDVDPSEGTEFVWDAMPGTEYVVQLYAIYEGGWSGLSREARVTTPVAATPAPEPPGDVLATVDGDTIGLSWSASPVGPPAHRFRVLFEGVAGGCQPAGGWLPADTRSWSAPTRRGCTYEPSVRAVSVDGAVSEPARPPDTSLYVPFDPPVGFTAVAEGAHHIRLSWTPPEVPPEDPPDGVWYEARIEHGSGTRVERLSPTDSTRLTGGWAADTLHRVSVATCSINGCGPFLPEGGIEVWTARDVLAFSGVVTGPDGQPLAGAQVHAYGEGDSWLPSAMVTTAADGSYSLTELPPSTWVLRVVPPAGSQLRTVWYPGKASRSAATRLSDHFGNVQTGLDVRISEGRTVSGVVTGNDGPLANVEVLAYASEDIWVPSVRTTTAVDGSYRLAGLDEASYRLHVRPPTGSGLRPLWYPGVQSRSSAAVVDLQAGSLSGVDMDWPSLAAVSGSVQGPDSSPLAGATVSLYQPGDWWFPAVTTTSAADGDYVFEGVLPASYVLRVAPPSSSGVAACWHGGTLNRSLSPPVVVGTDGVAGLRTTCPAL